jgi:hypothetical protein
VSDQGYLDHTSIVFETLTDIDNDSLFTDGYGRIWRKPESVDSSREFVLSFSFMRFYSINLVVIWLWLSIMKKNVYIMKLNYNNHHHLKEIRLNHLVHLQSNRKNLKLNKKDRHMTMMIKNLVIYSSLIYICDTFF